MKKHNIVYCESFIFLVIFWFIVDIFIKYEVFVPSLLKFDDNMEN